LAMACLHHVKLIVAHWSANEDITIAKGFLANGKVAPRRALQTSKSGVHIAGFLKSRRERIGLRSTSPSGSGRGVRRRWYNRLSNMARSSKSNARESLRACSTSRRALGGMVP
jgi:hypothetical protein